MLPCDNESYVRRYLEANVDPATIIYYDLLTRDNTKTPKVDIYIAGFLCQPFSTANSTRKGFEYSRGTVFDGCVDYIRKHLPTTFVLENVTGLRSIDAGRAYAYVMETLSAIESPGFYTVYVDTLNSQDYGVPQNRPRLYIVGIRADK